jgi:hypothetical protein
MRVVAQSAIVSGAQTERPLTIGPARELLGSTTAPAALFRPHTPPRCVRG